VHNILTIDVEDWYHLLVDEFDQWDSYTPRVEGATRQALDILSEYGVKATCFVLGYVAQRFPGLVKEIHARGHELGTHGHSHQLLPKQTPETFREELVRSIELIAQATGGRVEGHRASSFTVSEETKWALEILEDEGLRYDSSVSPTRNFFYGWPEAPRFPYRLEGLDLVEFPASTVEFLGYRAPLAGGFALRFFPYWFTRRKSGRSTRPVIRRSSICTHGSWIWTSRGSTSHAPGVSSDTTVLAPRKGNSGDCSRTSSLGLCVSG
jgi:polysaccharide deacetylase family protein (PEP-CTERM system associated)